MSAETFGRYKAEVEERIGSRERLALRNKMNSEKQLIRDIRGVERRDRNKCVFARRNGLRENAETTILCRWPGPARKKKEVYTSSREEGVDARMCPSGKAIESRTHVVGECEIYDEERDVLEEEVWEIDECNMQEFCTLDSSEHTIAIVGDRW